MSDEETTETTEVHGSTKDTGASDSPPVQVDTATVEVTPEDPSTPAQDVVDAVHDAQAENSTETVEVTETTTTENVESD